MALQDHSWVLRQARRVVAEKLKSFEGAIKYSRRLGRARPRAAKFLRDLPQMLRAVEKALDGPMLFGLEGMASRKWFEIFASRLAYAGPAPAAADRRS
jgi:CRISPR associated protein Cas1